MYMKRICFANRNKTEIFDKEKGLSELPAGQL